MSDLADRLLQAAIRGAPPPRNADDYLAVGIVASDAYYAASILMNIDIVINDKILDAGAKLTKIVEIMECAK
jgi:hypothetical protein